MCSGVEMCSLTLRKARAVCRVEECREAKVAEI